MNLKCSGFLFVLIVILEAINGLALNNLSISKNLTQDLSGAQSDKSQAENGTTTESVKIIIPNTSEIIPNLKFNQNSTPITTYPMFYQSTTPNTNTNTTTTPPPVPERGSWVVRNDTSKITCIIAEMAMQLNITYPGISETLKNAVINVPKESKANGSCSDPLQTLIISWGSGHSLQINFSINKTANNFFVSELTLNVNASIFKDAKGIDNSTIWHFKNTSSEFTTPLDMSYKCNKVQDINLGNEDTKLKAVLSLKNAQFEAYLNKTKADFGAAQDCDSFDTPDIVPIAVGCALAILVLVVLVAYLIGRKRSQNRGYLSM